MRANNNSLSYQNIINSYKDDESIISLSKYYNCGQGTITRILKSHNVKLRTIQESVGGVYIDPCEAPKIKKFYIDNNFTSQIISPKIHRTP